MPLIVIENRAPDNEKMLMTIQINDIVCLNWFRWFAASAILLCIVGCLQASDGSPRFLVRNPNGERYGYMDDSGKLVISYRFTHAQPFSSGLAAVTENESTNPYQRKYGYINQMGEWVVRPQYEWAEPFVDGLSAAIPEAQGLDSKKARHFVVLHKTGGNVQISEPIEGRVLAEGSHEQRIHFARKEGQIIFMGVVGPTGRVIVDPGDDNIGTIRVFRGGLAAAENSNGEWGFLDREGRWVLDPQYRTAGSLGYGLGFIRPHRSVENRETTGNRGWLVRFTGERVSSHEFTSVGPFHEGLAPAEMRTEDGLRYRTGFIDPSGKMVIELDYIDEQPFREGLAAVQVERHGQRVWGYIDHVGEWVIRPRFDDAEPFDHGLARAELGDRSGYIDREGEWFWIDDRGYVGGGKASPDRATGED